MNTLNEKIDAAKAALAQAEQEAREEEARLAEA